MRKLVGLLISVQRKFILVFGLIKIAFCQGLSYGIRRVLSDCGKQGKESEQQYPNGTMHARPPPGNETKPLREYTTLITRRGG